MRRSGLGKGLGKGYKNLVIKDPMVHGLSAKGVSLKKYSGEWYNQGSIPQWFSKDCKNSKAEYKVQGEVVNVVNTCNVNDKIKSVKGTARSVSDDNRKLEVDFGIPFFKGDYVIEYLDPSYENVIVGSSDKKYLWIMSRVPKLSEKKYQIMLDKAKNLGYKISEIKRLNAKSVKHPKVQILSNKNFEDMFAKDYKDGEHGYATTRINPDGNVNVYVRDSGDKERNKRLIEHELEELKIFRNLVDSGVNPNIADEMAHNLNPVKLKGVSPRYELDPYN